LPRRPDHARHDRAFVLDGPINRLAFETYVERVLVPELRQGDVVVMDNLSSHKARDLVTVVGHAATISAGEWITASGEWINDRATVSNSRRDFSRPRRRVRSTGSRNISAPG
jgi:hypothetical protein